MKKGDKEMEEIKERLDKILYWLEFIGKREAKDFLLGCLTEKKEIVLYQNSDGMKGISGLKKIAKMTDTTILDYWNKWEKIGILEKISVRGGDRGKRKFDLVVLGIDIPIIEQ